MAVNRRRVASSVDLSFVRSVVENVRDLNALRRMALRNIETIRFNIAHRVVSALYRRYNNYTKQHLDDHRPGFLEWLNECGAMHKTYRHHSYETSMYWATRPVVYAARSDLSYQLDMKGGEIASDAWYFELLTQLINKRDPREDVYLHVGKEWTRRVPNEAQPGFKLITRTVSASI